ncbi:MAG: hypothetical protein JWP41_3740, partial [Ramlibacter sp.]|nr:hypothetical protein [Ramlibacter sp.]
MKAQRSIAIVGAGAIGCRIAALLARQGVATTLFDGWAGHVAAMNRKGLLLELPDGSRESYPVRAHEYQTKEALPRFDIVLLAVRSDDTQAVLGLVQRLVK